MNFGIACAAVFFLALFAESWFSWRFLRQLKNDYPELWAASGSRTIWTDSNLTSAWPTIRYLKRREYLSGSRPEEIAFCEKNRSRVVGSYYAAWLGLGVALLGFPSCVAVFD